LIYTIEGVYRHKPAVDQYVENLCKELKLFKNLEIDIIFKNKLEGDCHGLCVDGDIIEIEISRTYENKPLPWGEQMCTLAHEMVHAKQFMRGEYPSEREAKEREYHLFGKCFPWNMVK
jgi:hypothetical protein